MVLVRASAIHVLQPRSYGTLVTLADAQIEATQNLAEILGMIPRQQEGCDG